MEKINRDCCGVGDRDCCGDLSKSACCHCEKKRIRSEEEYRSLCNRLSRIEGQIRGIRKMLDESAYCPDILNQAAAANAALNAFSRELLSQHLRSCVVNDLRAGNDEVVDELLSTLQKFMK
jgi:DNA-binding FrmR family transcriptional regulator